MKLRSFKKYWYPFIFTVFCMACNISHTKAFGAIARDTLQNQKLHCSLQYAFLKGRYTFNDTIVYMPQKITETNHYSYGLQLNLQLHKRFELSLSPAYRAVNYKLNFVYPFEPVSTFFPYNNRWEFRYVDVSLGIQYNYIHTKHLKLFVLPHFTGAFLTAYREYTLYRNGYDRQSKKIYVTNKYHDFIPGWGIKTGALLQLGNMQCMANYGIVKMQKSSNGDIIRNEKYFTALTLGISYTFNLRAPAIAFGKLHLPKPGLHLKTMFKRKPKPMQKSIRYL